MTSTKTKLKGAALFRARGRYAGHDSAEAQQSTGMAAVEAEIAKGTRNPPGYGPQAPTRAPLPFSPSSGPPQAPSAAEAIQRGSSGPPYAPTLRGRELAMFRQRWGRDPLPGEDMNFGTKPSAAGGAR